MTGTTGEAEKGEAGRRGRAPARTRRRGVGGGVLWIGGREEEEIFRGGEWGWLSVGVRG